MSRYLLSFRLGLCLLLILTGCSLPIAVDDDSWRVNGGMVPAPTTTQRANSLFERSESLGSDPTKSQAADNSAVELEPGMAEGASADDLKPGVNFRPFIP